MSFYYLPQETSSLWTWTATHSHCCQQGLRAPACAELATGLEQAVNTPVIKHKSIFHLSLPPSRGQWP